MSTPNDLGVGKTRKKNPKSKVHKNAQKVCKFEANEGFVLNKSKIKENSGAFAYIFAPGRAPEARRLYHDVQSGGSTVGISC